MSRVKTIPKATFSWYTAVLAFIFGGFAVMGAFAFGVMIVNQFYKLCGCY